MLRRLFRFSLLELLWMCGVLAVFLGLNLRMGELRQGWLGDHKGDGWHVSFAYVSEAGWPFDYFYTTNFSEEDHVYSGQETPIEIPSAEKRKAFTRDVAKIPGIIPGTHRLSFESAWNNKLDRNFSSSYLFANGLVALCAALTPLFIIRRLKRRPLTSSP